MLEIIRTIVKYLNYNTLYSDLMLMRASSFFDKHYYITYHPSIPEYKFSPYLHYLIFGQKFHTDPSPNFNSNWYLERYPDVLESEMNPLIHYLRYGKEESRQTYEPLGGNHIEFIGIPGSGKTTLYKKVNSYLKQKLGYRPGSLLLDNSMLHDVRVKCQINGAYACLCNFISEKREFFKSVLIADELYLHPNLPDNYLKSSSLRYFYTLCAFYQAVKQDKTKPWSMFDDGFYHQLARFVFDDTGNIRGEVSERILETIPKVDLLIHLNTDIRLCIKRMKERKKGIPNRYCKLPDEELFSRLSISHKQMNAFADYVRNLSTIVIEVDAGLSLQEGLSKVISVLSKLY